MPDWNERYAAPGYLFGTEPADFLKREGGRIARGDTVLCVADGEGRNSVYLARRGAHVTAMDGSPVAVDKARDLARARGVDIDFHTANIDAWDWGARQYDAVVAVFIQFAPPPMRDRIFAGIVRALRPGGMLLLHGYAPRQVEYGTGGPPVAGNMYTLDLLRAAFDGFEVLVAADYDADIAEGAGHAGRSALIDFVARKPG
jgi:SAM-dependent methyltransferase